MTEATAPAPDLRKITLKAFRFQECIIREFDAHGARQPDAVVTQSVNTGLDFNVDQGIINVRFQFVITVASGTGKALAEADVTLVFSFFIEELAGQLITVPSRPDPVPNARLSFTLVGTAYSTARGLLLAKFANTALEGFGLPLVDARSLVTGGSKKPEPETPKKRIKRLKKGI